eukprot:SAG31_NODE_14182_length_823_cov_1.020718_1_plen_183_part_01
MHAPALRACYSRAALHTLLLLPFSQRTDALASAALSMMRHHLVSAVALLTTYGTETSASSFRSTIGWHEEKVPTWLASQLAGASQGSALAPSILNLVREDIMVELPQSPLLFPREAGSPWPALEKWVNQSTFLQAYGNAKQHARWPTGGRQVGVLARPVTIQSYVDTMAVSEAGLLFDGSTVG